MTQAVTCMPSKDVDLSSIPKIYVKGKKKKKPNQTRSLGSLAAHKSVHFKPSSKSKRSGVLRNDTRSHPLAFTHT